MVLKATVRNKFNEYVELLTNLESSYFEFEAQLLLTESHTFPDASAYRKALEYVNVVAKELDSRERRLRAPFALASIQHADVS